MKVLLLFLFVCGFAHGDFMDTVKKMYPSKKKQTEQIHQVWYWVATNLQYKDDPKGQDIWTSAQETINRGYGDCEDYCIVVQQLLAERGISSNIVAIKLPQGYHAIMEINGIYFDPQTYNDYYNNPKVVVRWTIQDVKGKIWK